MSTTVSLFTTSHTDKQILPTDESIRRRPTNRSAADQTRHLFPIGAVAADVGWLPADVEEHVVLTGSPLLHEVRGEHPRPEHDAVVLETTCSHNKHVTTEHLPAG